MKQNKPFKISFIGDANVGKTSIVMRYVRNVFGDKLLPTIGVSNIDTSVEVTNGEIIDLNIWDTAGQERFRSLVPIYLKGASLIVLVFDISDISSYQNINHWLDLVNNLADEKCPILIVANKVDLEPAISLEEIKKFSTDIGKQIHFVSAKSDINIKDLFVEIALSAKESDEHKHIIDKQKESKNKSSCC